MSEIEMENWLLKNERIENECKKSKELLKLIEKRDIITEEIKYWKHYNNTSTVITLERMLKSLDYEIEKTRNI